MISDLMTLIPRSYLSSVFIVCVTMAKPSYAQVFNSLASFNGANGGQPQIMSLVQGADGGLYGTAATGGGGSSVGSVFELTSRGDLISLASFDYGIYPAAGLVLATDMNFYGTTEEGGANSAGTIFRVTPQGVLTTVYDFCKKAGCTDGGQPDAGLIQAVDGNLYGTTQLGGAQGYGTIFRMTSDGGLATLYSFCSQSNCADGAYPDAGLVEASDGDLYGTTNNTFFKITLAGALTTLYNFGGASAISSALIQASDGNFYGTAAAGGTRNDGFVLRLTADGRVTSIYTFCTVFEGGKCLDGISPTGSLIQANDGNLYGTTNFGGANGSGTIFGITKAGVLTTLYSFCAQSGCPDGSEPVGGLAQATNGAFFGTTSAGGVDDLGTVFALSAGLRRFVETIPKAGKVGSKVIILGTDLLGSTGVMFNSVPAEFTVDSATEITAIVPAGSTTGRVDVMTPRGTLSTDAAFHVL